MDLQKQQKQRCSHRATARDKPWQLPLLTEVSTCPELLLEAMQRWAPGLANCTEATNRGTPAPPAPLQLLPRILKGLNYNQIQLQHLTWMGAEPRHEPLSHAGDFTRGKP